MKKLIFTLIVVAGCCFGVKALEWGDWRAGIGYDHTIGSANNQKGYAVSGLFSYRQPLVLGFYAEPGVSVHVKRFTSHPYTGMDLAGLPRFTLKNGPCFFGVGASLLAGYNLIGKRLTVATGPVYRVDLAGPFNREEIFREGDTKPHELNYLGRKSMFYWRIRGEFNVWRLSVSVWYDRHMTDWTDYKINGIATFGDDSHDNLGLGLTYRF